MKAVKNNNNNNDNNNNDKNLTDFIALYNSKAIFTH